MSDLRRTPVYDVHLALGGRMVEFGGFEMPVQYSSILKEHAAVRERAGLFDVSHMGQIHLRGPGAVAFAEQLVTCHVASLKPGRVRYGVMCHESGGSVDDVTIYRMGDQHVFLCVNASNIDKDRRWIGSHAPADGVSVEDRSDATGLLALQGPLSAALLARLGAEAAGRVRRFAFTELEVAGLPTLTSRTGYTGSDGFELYVDADHAAPLFERLLEAGRADDVLPVGLGARDTLRLEAGLALYGHELNDETTPIEAGLERFVKLDAGGFLGADALRRQAEEGPARRLVGFELEERGVARANYDIVDADGARIGRVTSGAPSPTLGKSIGLGYVPPALAAVGSELGITIRSRRVRARVVDVPFHKRGS